MKALFLFSIIFIFISQVAAQKTIFFTGTTNSEEINSIAVCELDESRSEMSIINTTNGGKRPGYITISKDNNYLYAVSSESFAGDKNENTLNAYIIEKESWELKHIVTRSSHGINPCHISLNLNQNVLFTANYTSGSISSYPIQKNGSIDESVSIIQHKGSSTNLSRQEGPHAHYINTSIDGKYVYAADLGTDKIMIYKLNGSGQLLPNKKSEYLELPQGSGPRHMAFHENGKYVYILNELSNVVVSCLHDSSIGKLKIIDQDKTIDKNFVGNSYAAAIHIHPNGDYLYCSNRGENSISVFKIECDGELAKVQTFTEGLGTVRDFNISPSGLFLVAGNQAENELVLLRIDEDGNLSSTGQVLNLSEPTCVVFY